ncbi:hypothetical protein OAG68_02315 [bacterium]|nr:hypothetical protein [bacterium]
MLKEFEVLLKQLAALLRQRIEEELTEQWSLVSLDARYDGEGGVLTKIRAAKANDELVSLKTNNPIDLLLISLDNFRSASGPEWFGILMTISPSLECSVDFNYDSKCEQDPAFFDE